MRRAAEAPAHGSASATTPPRPLEWYQGSWRGEYKVERQRIDRPSLQAAWLRDDGTSFSGNGSLELSIDRRGATAGSAHGVLGEQTLQGVLDGDRLTLALVPHARYLTAFSGILSCTCSAARAHCQCEVSASSGDGNWVRQGSAHLHRATAPLSSNPP